MDLSNSPKRVKSSSLEIPIALTIAGSDSSGGAGIQADLRAFEHVGVYGASVITCVTAQNTTGVQAIEPLPPEIISAQLGAIFQDLKPVAIKTGMLYSSEIVELVGKSIRDYVKTTKSGIDIIIDPVMVATAGSKLTVVDDEFNKFLNALTNSLFPIATVITPNIPEAEQILDLKIKNFKDMKNVCEKLYEFGPKFVLLKGGHSISANGDKDSSELTGKAVDLLYNGEFLTYEYVRLDKDIHGTGCTIASLITGLLATGLEVPKAVETAKEIIFWGIKDSLKVGSGVEAINITRNIKLHNFNNKIEFLLSSKRTERNPEQVEIISQINSSANKLSEILNPYFIPEVGINLGFALKDASSQEDICALTGRLNRVGKIVGWLGSAEFGASKHVSRIILSAMKNDPRFRCAMNIKYRPEIIKKCEELNLSIGSFNRGGEPEEVSSMEWGTNNAIEKLGFVPDIIYDLGGVGKEPMIRILGYDPDNVIDKVITIINSLKID
jgi:hydroxymethylpyrimidine/phosphomethylpyrimidine kinase